jgi:hypothetical protein
LQSIDFDTKILYGVVIKMANQIGKRYVCKKCGSEFIVTKGGDGTIACCDQPMELKKIAIPNVDYSKVDKESV